jgi:outer membrane immunogenic protein
LAYDWSGFYIGGVIGGGWSHVDSSDPGLGLIGTLINTPVIQTTTGSAFIGGIEGGDRYQFGKLVVGLEADMTWGSPGLITFNRALSANEKWTGTATSSVGIAHTAG